MLHISVDERATLGCGASHFRTAYYHAPHVPNQPVCATGSSEGSRHHHGFHGEGLQPKLPNMANTTLELHLDCRIFSTYFHTMSYPLNGIKPDLTFFLVRRTSWMNRDTLNIEQMHVLGTPWDASWLCMVCVQMRHGTLLLQVMISIPRYINSEISTGFLLLGMSVELRNKPVRCKDVRMHCCVGVRSRQ